MIFVRRATLDDIEAIVAAYTAAWRAGFQYMFSAAVFEVDGFDAARRTECTDGVFRDGTDTFVGELDGRVVGYVNTVQYRETLGRVRALQARVERKLASRAN